MALRSAVSRHAWVAVLVVGGALFWLVLDTLVRTQNPNFVPSLILLGAAVVPVSFVTFVYHRAGSALARPDLVVLASFLGGVVGVVVAGRLEFDALRTTSVAPMVLVGLIEESAKLIVPVLVLLLTRSWRRVNGLVLGVAVGMGFAVLETMGYAFVTLLRSGGSIGAVEQLLLLRGVLSPAAHAAWTGLATAALWSAARSHWRARAVLRLVATFVGVVVLHALWDGIGTWWAYAVLAVVSLGLVGRRLHALTVAHRRLEAQRAARALALVPRA
jgi:protease PrsW